MAVGIRELASSMPRVGMPGESARTIVVSVVSQGRSLLCRAQGVRRYRAPTGRTSQPRASQRGVSLRPGWRGIRFATRIASAQLQARLAVFAGVEQTVHQVELLPQHLGRQRVRRRLIGLGVDEPRARVVGLVLVLARLARQNLVALRWAHQDALQVVDGDVLARHAGCQRRLHVLAQGLAAGERVGVGKHRARVRESNANADRRVRELRDRGAREVVHEVRVEPRRLGGVGRAIELEVDLIPAHAVEHHVEVLAQIVVLVAVVGEQRGLRGDGDLPACRVQLVGQRGVGGHASRVAGAVDVISRNGFAQIERGQCRGQLAWWLHVDEERGRREAALLPRCHQPVHHWQVSLDVGGVGEVPVVGTQHGYRHHFESGRFDVGDQRKERIGLFA